MNNSTNNQQPPKRTKKWLKRLIFGLVEVLKVISSLLNILRFFDD
ncbi:hypothetical protein [Psychrobacter sp. FDAARGOS_221]|nr:hypothetical protein [Psychrobacter sp. FDAARGOS_221]